MTYEFFTVHNEVKKSKAVVEIMYLPVVEIMNNMLATNFIEISEIIINSFFYVFFSKMSPLFWLTKR